MVCDESESFAAAGCHFVGDGIPVHVRVVDDHLRNGLGDDALHDLLNGALLGQGRSAGRRSRP